MAEEDFRQCERCRTRYDWRRSTTMALKMTFCSTLCEKGALGFTLETVLSGVRILRREWRPLLVS